MSIVCDREYTLRMMSSKELLDLSSDILDEVEKRESDPEYVIAAIVTKQCNELRNRIHNAIDNGISVYIKDPNGRMIVASRENIGVTHPKMIQRMPSCEEYKSAYH